ncbi:hypothetical protein JL09_g4328 [Pichia kudriavzevii]|uniref:Myb-like domain-containing protein n=1 Tax=Pichia kudriavzevii TaxID=4909 RepID=A0A099NX94_PICKU|nr:hypothetical protein JL09_g4328 [Pichia kudriavzevii]
MANSNEPNFAQSQPSPSSNNIESETPRNFMVQQQSPPITQPVPQQSQIQQLNRQSSSISSYPSNYSNFQYDQYPTTYSLPVYTYPPEQYQNQLYTPYQAMNLAQPSVYSQYTTPQQSLQRQQSQQSLPLPRRARTTEENVVGKTSDNKDKTYSFSHAYLVQPQAKSMGPSYPPQIPAYGQFSDPKPTNSEARKPTMSHVASSNNINKPVSLIDKGNNRHIKLDYSKIDRLTYELSQNMLLPPFKSIKPNKESLREQKPKRSKRKSKFSKEQDEIILRLKKENKNWVEIAEAAKVDSYLAARNRYQVLIGQQGGSASDCGPDDVLTLKTLLDDGEIEKMKYLTKEFRKCTGKSCDYRQVRELIRYLFWKDAGQFDVGVNYLEELQQKRSARHEEFGETDAEYDSDEDDHDDGNDGDDGDDDDDDDDDDGCDIGGPNVTNEEAVCNSHVGSVGDSNGSANDDTLGEIGKDSSLSNNEVRESPRI